MILTLLQDKAAGEQAQLHKAVYQLMWKGWLYVKERFKNKKT